MNPQSFKIGDKINTIICDIEGTTTSISFVKVNYQSYILIKILNKPKL